MADRRARGPQTNQWVNPVEYAQEAFEDFQNGPDIQRPTMAQSFIPVIGPAWEAVADLQDGNYGRAAFNGAMAVADALPVGVAVKGVNAARKGISVLKKGSVTAGAAAKQIKKVISTKGKEIHHTVPLDGLGRSVQDWRNHYAFLKVMPIEQHRRLTGGWAGKPRYDEIRRMWYGTTDWMKAIPVGVAGYAADAYENTTRARPKVPPEAPRKPKR